MVSSVDLVQYLLKRIYRVIALNHEVIETGNGSRFAGTIKRRMCDERRMCGPFLLL